MIDKEKIEERLGKLREYFLELKKYQLITKKEFLNNSTVSAAVERYLQLSIEALIDIGEILIANLRLRKPETSKEVILILGEAKILPKKFARKLSPAAGFRNILVHGYLTVDKEKVYHHLQNDLSDFGVFTKYVLNFLMSRKR